ncbi:MAG: hypothetical protein RL693_2704 [Verrucomicrobiota bacterium]
MPTTHDTSCLRNHGAVMARNYGSIEVTEVTNGFGFHIRACNPLAHPSLYLALTTLDSPQPVTFAVRVDLESGEIWDIGNNTGMLGWLDRDLWPNPSEDFPLVLRWEIEHTGHSLIPRLLIGEEEWLYPSVAFPGDAQFTALAGHDMNNAAISEIFSPGYVWSLDRLK